MGILCSFASLVSYFTRVLVPGRRSTRRCPFVADLATPGCHFFIARPKWSPATLPPISTYPFSREIKRHVEATWTRSADERVAGDISRHLRAQTGCATMAIHCLLSRPSPSPPPSHPSKSPYLRPLFLTLARVCSCSRQWRNAVSLSPEVSKGWREVRLFTYFHSRDLVRA
jgi:hypothetical protein